MVYYVVTLKSGLPSIWPRPVSDTSVDSLLQFMGATLVGRCATEKEADALQREMLSQYLGITPRVKLSREN